MVSIRSLLGVALVSVCVIPGTLYLQESLILFYQVGLEWHWLAILFGIPLLAGVAVRILIKPKAPLVIAVSGALLCTLGVFPFYRLRFWAEPAPYPLAFLYGLVVTGLVVAANLRFPAPAPEPGLVRERLQEYGQIRFEEIRHPLQVRLRFRRLLSERGTSILIELTLAILASLVAAVGVRVLGIG